jgi:hypothetical protein
MEFPVAKGPGRPRVYCRRSHRQRHYEARTLAARHGLAPSDALVDRDKLGRLNDRLYILEAACEDVRNDLAEAHDIDAYRDAVVHLLEAALPLQSAYVEPRAIGESPASR